MLSDSGFFIYDVGTHAITTLGDLNVFTPIGASLAGSSRVINDSNQVVGRINAGGGVYHAAVWENGNITDLNTLYAGVVPNGFILNFATAIDNNGDIAGYGTDASGLANQAFLLRSADVRRRQSRRQSGHQRPDDRARKLRTEHRGESATGDFNGDGKVDINDLTIVLANYNQTFGSSADGIASVPEPSSLILFGIGVIGLLVWRSRGKDKG